jgi:hypothetical protein
MSLTTPSKIRELQIKLYRKAKNEFPVQSRGTRHFSDEVVFWETWSPVASRCPSERSFVGLAVKPVGKPDALCGLQNYVAPQPAIPAESPG